MAAFSQTATFRDAKGQVSVMRFYVTAADQETAAPLGEDIVNAAAALSNAHLDSATGAFTSSATTFAYGTDAAYPTIEDKLVLAFKTASGANHRYRVPAPKTAVFLADDETADPANGLVTAFRDAMIAGGASRDDVAIATFQGGVRDRVRIQRKFNIITRTPALTGPGL